MKALRVLCGLALSTLAPAFFLALLASLASIPDVPRAALAGLAGLAVLALLRPEHALAALAVGVPIASWIGRQWTAAVAWPETLAVAFCAGYCARGIRLPRRDSTSSADALAPPLFAAVAVVVASVVLQVLIDAWRFGETSMVAELWRLVGSAYFVTAGASDPIDAAMRLLESLIVFRAAVTVTRRVPQFGLRLTMWLAIGASAAAALNLVRLWEGAARMEAPVSAFVRYLLTFRLNVHYADVNAAGSYFVAMLFVALGLAAKRRAWWIAVVLVSTSLWLSGSRMAYVAGVLAILLPAIFFSARITRVGVRGTVLTAAALALAILAGAAAYAIPARGNQQSLLTAFKVRWELALTSFRMTAVRPAFGVGVGRYYSRSGEFSSPELLRIFPPAVHENAHNNFLQLLAELGTVGFAAVAWLLATAALLGTRLIRAAPRDPIRWGLVLGALAFVLTWLGSHPLLIDEPAFVFWMLLGLIGGWGDTGAMTVGTARSFSIATLIVLATAVSVPVRFVQQRADFDLNHRGVGLSPWQDAVDGVRYRLAGPTSSVFVPSDARLVVVPLRATASHDALRVQMLLDGRPADVVTLSSERWQLLRIQIPQERRAPRFHRLELKVDGQPPESTVVMIGKVEPR